MSFQFKKDEFLASLTEWGVINYRQFPWRATKHPYEILIAELFLQRTKADQVKQIYPKFLNMFPNPNKLCNADIKEVLKLLYPLGLAYRANRLITIGTILVELYGGEVPRKKIDLLNLPGVGNYIANSVLLLAFGRCVAPIDANIMRILIRFFDISSKEVKPMANSLMRQVSEKKSYHYSILDFGAIICKPRKPNCIICPVEGECSFKRMKYNF
ncbi:MAG: A/G-specific adenine glycosylase [Candidatus Hermodarchaeota archaeon]